MLSFPFHRTSDAGELFFRTMTRSRNLQHGLIQLPPSARRWLVPAAGVHPTAILQLHMAVVAEEIRSTDGPVGPGHFLALVVQVWEREPVRLGEVAHLLEGIIRVSHGVVGANGYGLHAVVAEFPAGNHDALDGAFHVGAVVADEQDEGGFLAAAVRQGPVVAVHPGQTEAVRLGAELAERSVLSSHACSLLGIGLQDSTRPQPQLMRLPLRVNSMVTSSVLRLSVSPGGNGGKRTLRMSRFTSSSSTG